MASFTDNKQRQWDIAIDAPSILRIREDCDPRFLLNDDEDDNTYTRMQTDPVLLCRVIFLLCAKQRTERSVTEEDFYLNVIGDAIDDATEAMLEAIKSFIPRRMREWVVASAAKATKLKQMGIEKALAKINDPALEEKMLESLDQAMDAEVERMLTQLLSATNSPAGSASPQSA